MHEDQNPNTEALIDGPLRKTVREAATDLAELHVARRVGGLPAARAEAARMDADAMTARFVAEFVAW